MKMVSAGSSAVVAASLFVPGSIGVGAKDKFSYAVLAKIEELKILAGTSGTCLKP